MCANNYSSLGSNLSIHIYHTLISQAVCILLPSKAALSKSNKCKNAMGPLDTVSCQ